MWENMLDWHNAWDDIRRLANYSVAGPTAEPSGYLYQRAYAIEDKNMEK